MNSNRFSLVLFVFAAFFASFQIPRSGGSAPNPDRSARPPAREEPKAAAEARNPSEEQADPWKEAAEAVAGFLSGVPSQVQETQGGATRTSKDEVAGLRGKAAGYTFESLIVLVPDPVESGLSTGFDEALVAVQEAYADKGYLLDRFWLPWAGKAKERSDYRKIPGLLLFRYFHEDCKKIAAVLVVGEVPRQGVHPAAFQEALRLVEGWENQVEKPEIRIAGPYFSDSADSVRRSLTSVVEPRQVRLISGSAMAQRLSCVFASLPNVSFGQAIVTEQRLQELTLPFFRELGWDTRRVALLTQADSAFGQPFLTEHNRKNFILARFPTGISGIRTAWEGDTKALPDNAGSQQALEIPKTTLDITLADRDRPVHLLPETGTFTSASRDLAISNLLAVIGSRGIDYIGIVATDPLDTLFLAERIRRLAPSKILFIINNHLLFTHPQSSPLMNGTLVLSSYPLFAESRRWRQEFGGPQEKYLRQFTSSFHEGIYRAVGELRSPGALPRGDRHLAWMSVIGNSSLWPIAHLGAEEVPSSDAGKLIGEGISPRTNNKLIWFLVGLCLLAFALVRLGEVPHCARREALLPLSLAPFVLWLTGVALAILGTLPYRHLQVPLEWQRDWKLLIAGALWIALHVLLARFAACTWKIRPWGGWFLAFLTGSVFLFPHLEAVLRELWMPGGTEHFYQRVFVLSSGLSPLVSLTWLGGALYLWSLAELRRYQMALRQKLCWPVPIGFSARPGDGEAVESLETSVTGSLSLGFRPALLLPTLFASVLILLPLRPIAETSAYGRLFGAFLGVTLFLGAMSFCRFLWSWILLHRLLKRLALPSPPQGLDADLAQTVAWKPMRSFGWRIPLFGTSTTQAVECLAELEKARVLRETGVRPDDIRKLLEEAMDAARAGDLELEMEKRNHVDSLLCSANGALVSQSSRLTRRFYALRLISFLRYMFAHLRSFLIAALACGFPLLAAASTYAYEPNEYVTNSIWSILLIAVVLTLGVFYQMDRDEILSKIADTTPGQISLSRDLVLGTVTYGVVPLLGLIVAQFPNVGRYFVTLLNPLMRALGTGG